MYIVWWFQAAQGTDGNRLQDTYPVRSNRITQESRLTNLSIRQPRRLKSALNFVDTETSQFSVRRLGEAGRGGWNVFFSVMVGTLGD